MEPHSILSAVFLLFALLAANAFFATAEFSLLTLWRTAPDRGIREGEGRATRLQRLLARADELLLLAQLARSATTAAFGYLAARLGVALLGATPLSQAGAVVVAVVLAGMVHTVLGEQIPRLIGIQRAHSAGVWVALEPLRWLSYPLRPLTWVLCRGVGGLARRAGLSFPATHALAHTPDEIRLLVAQGHEQGVVEEDEREMIHGVFEFSDTVAREVMTPRIDVVAVPVDISLPDLIEVLVREGRSRVPVYEGTIDTVVGVLLAKDLLPLLTAPEQQRGAGFEVRRVMRAPYFVPDTKPVDDILAEFRQNSVHLAIVLDEFGGTYGLVTMEDLLEEIVGEIHDEYDVAEPEFAPTPDGDVLIDGGAAISDVNARFGLALPDKDYDTLGGFVFGTLGRVPVPGDEIAGLGEDQTRVLQVEETEERRVLRVRLTRSAAVEEAVGVLLVGGLTPEATTETRS